MVKVKRFFIKIVLWMLLPFVRLRNWTVKRLLKLRAKLQLGSLREAIVQADQDKEKTGRKNMVVFNTTSGKYEPVQKKLLKAASQMGKNRSNKAHTEGRRRMLKHKERAFTPQRVKHIEKKSLYVTN
jgi:hypothetical protein